MLEILQKYGKKAKFKLNEILCNYIEKMEINGIIGNGEKNN